MNTLFNLEDPAVTVELAPQVKTKRQPRFYLYFKDADGRTWVFWKGHDNGDDEHYVLADHPKRVPHLFKTYGGAHRRKHTWSVGIWGETKHE